MPSKAKKAKSALERVSNYLADYFGHQGRDYEPETPFHYGLFGENDDGGLVDLIRRHKWDPKVAPGDFDDMLAYAEGHVEMPDRMNELIDKYGLTMPDQTLYRGFELPRHIADIYKSEGLIAHRRPQSTSTFQEVPNDFNAPTSRDNDSLLVDIRGSQEYPIRGLPLPISGQNEVVLPAGGKGGLKVLDWKTSKDEDRYQGFGTEDWDNVVHDVLTRMYHKYEKGGKVHNEVSREMLETLIGGARNFGGSESEDTRARIATGLLRALLSADDEGNLVYPGWNVGADGNEQFLMPTIVNDAMGLFSDSASKRSGDAETAINAMMNQKEPEGFKQHAADMLGYTLAQPAAGAKKAVTSGAKGALTLAMDFFTPARMRGLKNILANAGIGGGIGAMADQTPEEKLAAAQEAEDRRAQQLMMAR